MRVSKLHKLVRRENTLIKVAPKTSALRRLKKPKRRKVNEGTFEMRRVLGVPVMLPPSEEDHALMNARLVSGLTPGFELRGVQTWAVREFVDNGGLFAPIGCGGGKTLINLLCGEIAYHASGGANVLLTVPPDIYYQFLDDIEWAKSRIRMTARYIPLGQKTRPQRTALTSSGRRGIFIMPTSLWSVADTEDMLARINPCMIGIDEAHLFANRRSARTRRLLRYLRARSRSDSPVAFLAMSGTMSRKSIMDFHHLLIWALGEGAPLPLSPHEAMEWGNAIDSSRERAKPKVLLPMRPLLRWGRKHHPHPKELRRTSRRSVRMAFQHRLTTTPGVVTTSSAEFVPCSLQIHATSPKPSDTLRDMIIAVDEDYIAPTGDELEHAISKHRYLYELSCGFYHDQRWPDEHHLLAEGLAHYEALQEYRRELRTWLRYNAKPGLDTPFLVAGNMANYGRRDVSDELFKRWRAAGDLYTEGLPERISVPVLVDPYKLDAAADYAEEHPRRTLIWYHNRAVGEWMHSRLEARGIEHTHCPSGVAGSKLILRPETAETVALASISGHGTGKNLQAFHNVLFLQWPQGSVACEQALARVHRPGFSLDTLVAHCFMSTKFDHVFRAATCLDALFQQQSSGEIKRLVYANYVPKPRNFSPDYLLEQGFLRGRGLL